MSTSTRYNTQPFQQLKMLRGLQKNIISSDPLPTYGKQGGETCLWINDDEWGGSISMKSYYWM